MPAMQESRNDVHAIERSLAAIAAAQASGDSSVVIIGSMNADYTVDVEQMPRPGETITGGPLHLYPGGKSANQAASSARLGQRTLMLGAVGQDSNADFLTGTLSEAGVDTSGIERVEGPSGSTIIVVDSQGENFIVVSAGSNGEVTEEYAARHRSELESADVIGLCLESPLATVVAAAHYAAMAGATVVLNVSPLPESLPAQLIAETDVVIMNEHETAQFLGWDEDISLDDSDWTAVHAALAGRGFERAVVTLGAAGSVVLDGSEPDFAPIHILPYRVKPVDTTGAGDSFMGSLLAGLAAGLPLVDACSLASVVSAYSTQGKGAQSSYGSAADVLEFVRSQVSASNTSN